MQFLANISSFFFQVEEDFVPAPSLLLPLLGGAEVETEKKEEALKTRMVEMARTERMILKALDFRLRASTAATFLHYFTQVYYKVLKGRNFKPPSLQHDLNKARLSGCFPHLAPGPVSNGAYFEKWVLRLWEPLK